MGTHGPGAPAALSRSQNLPGSSHQPQEMLWTSPGARSSIPGPPQGTQATCLMAMMRSSLQGGQEDTKAGEGGVRSSQELSYVESSEPEPRLTAACCDRLGTSLGSEPSPVSRDAGSPPSLLRACLIRASHAHSLQNRLSWQQAWQDGMMPGGRAGTSPWERPKQTRTGTGLAPGAWHLSHHLPTRDKAHGFTLQGQRRFPGPRESVEW